MMDDPSASSSSSSPYSFLPHATLRTDVSHFLSPSSRKSLYLSPPPNSTSTSTPTSSSRTFQSPSYITQLVSLDSQRLLLLTSNGVQLVDKGTTSLLGGAMGVRGSDVGLGQEATAIGVMRTGDTGSIWGVTNRKGSCCVYDARGGGGGGGLGVAMTVDTPTSSPLLCLEFSSPCSSSSAAPLLALGHELHSIDAPVYVYDLRNLSTPLLTYDQSHSDDVTSLAFRPSASVAPSAGPPSEGELLLLSASTDGLLTLYDLNKGTDEDEAVVSASNTGASIARAGWGGAADGVGVKRGQVKPDAQVNDNEEEEGGGRKGMEVDGASQRGGMHDETYRGLGAVWAVSDMQTVGVWDSESTDALLPPLSVLPLSASLPASSTWGSSTKFQPDYIIDCFASDPCAYAFHNDHDDEAGRKGEAVGLSLFTGSQSGSFSLNFVPSPFPQVALTGGARGQKDEYDAQAHLRSVTSQIWNLTHFFPSESYSARGGHSDIVRCVEFQQSCFGGGGEHCTSGTLWSGGEDGKLVVWSIGKDGNGGDDDDDDDDAVEEKSRPGFGLASRVGSASRSVSGSGSGSGLESRANVMDHLDFTTTTTKGIAGTSAARLTGSSSGFRGGGSGSGSGRYRPYG